MRIGILGSGLMGAKLETIFARAGHEVVFSDARIVATSMLFLDDGLAGIHSVATLRDELGKGTGGYVTAHPLRVAHALGCRMGALQSSDAGYLVYLGPGFIDVGEAPMFTPMPTDWRAGSGGRSCSRVTENRKVLGLAIPQSPLPWVDEALQ